MFRLDSDDCLQPALGLFQIARLQRSHAAPKIFVNKSHGCYLTTPWDAAYRNTRSAALEKWLFATRSYELSHLALVLP